MRLLYRLLVAVGILSEGPKCACQRAYVDRAGVQIFTACRAVNQSIRQCMESPLHIYIYIHNIFIYLYIHVLIWPGSARSAPCFCVHVEEGNRPNQGQYWGLPGLHPPRPFDLERSHQFPMMLMILGPWDGHGAAHAPDAHFWGGGWQASW